MHHVVALIALFPVATIAKADSCGSTGSDLVVNCGFESGSFAGWSGSTTANQDSGVDALDPYAGTYEAFLGAVGATTTLTQLLQTVPGQSYTLQFALRNDTDPVGQQNSFAALFGDAVLFSQGNVPADAYTTYEVTATATGAITSLSFLSRNDGGYFFLDDVSFVASGAEAPEPSSLVLLGTGLLGMTSILRRRSA